MSVLNPNTEKLFSKVLSINVKGLSYDEIRIRKLALNLEWLPSSSSHKKMMAVHLTDNNDPFFYYMATINEDDFLTLKNKQDLLVDFVSFPKMFIDLLEKCIMEDIHPQPKYIVSLYIDKGSEFSKGAILDIVEKNPFKHIIHLSLVLPEVSNVIQKEYITSCYRSIKEEKDRLESRLHSIEEDLTKQLQNCEHISAKKISELQHIIKEKEEKLEDKERKLNREISNLKKEFSKKQKDEASRWEHTYKEKDERYKNIIHNLEDKVTSYERKQKDQELMLSTNENTIKDLRTRLDSAEQKVSKLQERSSKSEREIERLQSQLSESHQEHNALINEKVKLQRANEEKEETIAKLRRELELTSKEKVDLLSEHKQLIHDLNVRKETERGLKLDLEKSRDIIRKFQTEVRNSHEKLKQKARQVQKLQEKFTVQEETCKDLYEKLAVAMQQAEEKENLIAETNEKLRKTEKELQRCLDNILVKDALIKHLDDQIHRRQFTPNIEFTPDHSNSNKIQEISHATNSSTGIRSPSIQVLHHPLHGSGVAQGVLFGATGNTAPNATNPSESCLDQRYLQKHRNFLVQNPPPEEPSFLHELYGDVETESTVFHNDQGDMTSKPHCSNHINVHS